MRRFLFQNLQSLRTPYRLSGDLLLSQEDILQSKFIRDLIQLLTNTILSSALSQSAGLISVNVTSVSIRGRRIHASGDVWPTSAGSGAAMGFEISLGAGVRDEGQVVYLRDIRVVLNPSVTLLRTSFPIPLSSPIDIDLGPDCRLDSLVISDHHIWIRFKSVISPVAPFSVAPVQRRAMFYYDLAALLSSVLRLRGGVAMRWVNR